MFKNGKLYISLQKFICTIRTQKSKAKLYLLPTNLLFLHKMAAVPIKLDFYLNNLLLSRLIQI